MDSVKTKRLSTPIRAQIEIAKNHAELRYRNRRRMHPERVRGPPKHYTPKDVPFSMQTKRKRPASVASSASKRGKEAASTSKRRKGKTSKRRKGKKASVKSRASSASAPGPVADDDQADSREDKRSKDTARQIARMRALAKKIGISMDPFVEEYRRASDATIVNQLALEKPGVPPVVMQLGRGSKGFAKSVSGRMPARLAIANRNLQREIANTVNLLYGMMTAVERTETAVTFVKNGEAGWGLPVKSMDVGVELLAPTRSGRRVFKISLETDVGEFNRCTLTLFARTKTRDDSVDTPVTTPGKFEIFDVARMAVFTMDSPNVWKAKMLAGGVDIAAYQLAHADDVDDALDTHTRIADDAWKPKLHGATPADRRGLLPLPELDFDGDVLTDDQFLICDSGGRLDSELRTDPVFRIRCRINDLDAMDHDRWEALRYEVLMYPGGEKEQLDEDKGDEGKCAMCPAPPTGSSSFCSQCAALMATFAAEQARATAKGAGDSDEGEESDSAKGSDEGEESDSAKGSDEPGEDDK